MGKDAAVLWTDQPLVIDYSNDAKPRDEEAFWEQAVYPIGNGRLGCTAFGEPQRELAGQLRHVAHLVKVEGKDA